MFQFYGEKVSLDTQPYIKHRSKQRNIFTFNSSFSLLDGDKLKINVINKSMLKSVLRIIIYEVRSHNK